MIKVLSCVRYVRSSPVFTGNVIDGVEHLALSVAVCEDSDRLLAMLSQTFPHQVAMLVREALPAAKEVRVVCYMCVMSSTYFMIDFSISVYCVCGTIVYKTFHIVENSKESTSTVTTRRNGGNGFRVDCYCYLRTGQRPD